MDTNLEFEQGRARYRKYGSAIPNLILVRGFPILENVSLVRVSVSKYIKDPHNMYLRYRYRAKKCCRSRLDRTCIAIQRNLGNKDINSLAYSYQTMSNCVISPPDSRMRRTEHSLTCFTRRRSGRWSVSNTSECHNP